MGLESIFKLSLIMNMIDNLTGPMSSVQSSVGGSVSKLQGMQQTLGGVTKGGLAMAAVGSQITEAALSPVSATFATRKALGELSSLGVKDLGAIEDAAKQFSNTWAGTTKADFITAAYDIKSGIASLSDEGVAGYTEISGLTAKATKASIGEMTDLFATGYGIYKDFYSDMSDMEFGEMFSAGISKSVQQFKTDGSQMAQAIKTLGASATTAQVPIEEQLSVLGMLQASMSGSEAGTKYKAFIRSAVKGGEELGLSFVDANNQLLSMPEIMDQLRGKFGETMDAAEKMELQKAFGDTEAVALIDLMYNKTGDLQGNILTLYDSMGQGRDVAQQMANAINQTEPDQYQVLQQRIQNVKESIGNSLLPTINEYMAKGEELLTKVDAWISNNQELVQIIMLVVLTLGGFLTVSGTVIATVGSIGLVFTKTAGFVTGFFGTVRKLPGMFDTIRIYGMYAGDGVKKGFSLIRSAGSGALSSIKTFGGQIAGLAKTAGGTALSGLKSLGSGIVGLGRQAISTVASAMGPLIASVWSFTAALLANPITWVVIGIMALIAGLILLYNKCEWFRNLVDGIISFLGEKLGAALATTKKIFTGIGNVIGSVMGAARDTVKEKLGNMKDAYEKHGGGIKGAAAAAVEGVKGYYTAGLTFLDNLTGGKLSAIKDQFGEKLSGIKESVGQAMEGAKQYASDKLAGMQAVYQSHGGGIRGTVAAAMSGVRSVYSDAFNFIDNITGGKLSSIRGKVQNGINNIKTAISSSLSWFRESGAKVMKTFTDGIKSAISGPVEAVKGGLQKIRNMLPFSDAKTGPLSTLTLSGIRTMSTYAAGIQKGEALPGQAAAGALDGVKQEAGGESIIKRITAAGGNFLKGAVSKVHSFLASVPKPDGPVWTGDPSDEGPYGIEATRSPVRSVELRENSRETRTYETTTERTETGGVTINTLELKVDFKNLKELPALLALLREVQDYANGNGSLTLSTGEV
ncbi:phage tail tape measure protein [Hungatella effluvii]|uniref:phage tail tape measure protein n=1 Tax=Hungatella effluvii TaxID=1096246 RepID=UPI0022E68220|nr:phage tail tape measure protein [Hungatella effluvii]